MPKKFDPRRVRACIDVMPTSGELPVFARLAVGENPSNVALGLDQSLAQGVVMPMEIALVTAKKWQTGRTIRVAFMDGDERRREMVRAGCRQWAQHAHVGFQFDAPVHEAEVRVSFRHQGAWSYVGTDCLGVSRDRPTMNYGFIDEGTVLHEVGHALGCIHEHQHPEGGIPWDRDAVYRYYAGPPNYWNRRMVDSNVFEKYSRNITQFSRYDPQSIMHYPTPPELLTERRAAVGWNRALSPADVAFISSVYHRPAPAPAPALCPDGGPPVPPSGTYRLASEGGLTKLVLNG